MTTTDLPAPTTAHPIARILGALADAGFRLTVISAADDCHELTIATTPRPTWEQAMRVFADLGAPSPDLYRADDTEPRDSHRVTGPIPALGITHLSIAVDL